MLGLCSLHSKLKDFDKTLEGLLNYLYLKTSDVHAQNLTEIIKQITLGDNRIKYHQNIEIPNNQHIGNIFNMSSFLFGTVKKSPISC